MSNYSRLSEKEEREQMPVSLPDNMKKETASSDKESKEEDSETSDKQRGEEDFEFSVNGLPVIYASSLRDAYDKIDHYQNGSDVNPEVKKKFQDNFSQQHKKGKVMFELRGTKHSDGIKEFVDPKAKSTGEQEEADQTSKSLHKSPLPEARYSIEVKDNEDFLEDSTELLQNYSHQFGCDWLESALCRMPELGDAYDLLTALTGETALTGMKPDVTDRALSMLGVLSISAPGKMIRVKRKNHTCFISESLYKEALENPDKILKEYREQAIQQLKKLWGTMEKFLKELPNESRSNPFRTERAYHKVKKINGGRSW